MYLLEIDPKTRLVKDDVTADGWKAIKAFTDLVGLHGIKGLTVIALVQDYQTLLRHYSLEDRPFRAMEEVYEDREALDFSDKIIIAASLKYKELQFNSDLEQEQINNEIKMRYIRRIAEANQKEDDVEIEKNNKLLQRQEQTIKSFNDRFDRKEALNSAVTLNNYTLSRIENDIATRKNSKFVLHKSDKNPNKLNIQ
jgi:hypothetical protein